MAYVPFTPEKNGYYRLTNPTNGVSAYFNVPYHMYNVGTLAEVAGLTVPEVREAADDLVQADGGTHGDFYFGRRPITMEAVIHGHQTIAERNTKIDLLMRATAALRADATLAYRPSNRVENIVLNPSLFFDSVGYGAYAGAGTGAVTLTSAARTAADTRRGSAGAWEVTSTTTATPASFAPELQYSTPLKVGDVGVNSPFVVAGSAKLVTAPTAASYVRIFCSVFQASGAYVGSVTSASATAQINNPTVGTWYDLNNSYTLPTSLSGTTLTSDMRLIVSISFFFPTQTASAAYTMRSDGYVVTPNSTTLRGYHDGDTVGYNWLGTPHSAQSGDFIEVFTPVRRGAPLRVSGQWNKQASVSLVSEYATLQSSYLQNATGAAGATVTAENKGSWTASPVFRVTGASATDFTITNTAPNPDTVFRTTGGLTVASGETLEIDTLNRTAYFVAGARNGQSANRYIDFTNTTWPLMPTGSNTFVLSGTGTLTVSWRDTWV